jgi:hypothetical protein
MKLLILACLLAMTVAAVAQDSSAQNERLMIMDIAAKLYPDVSRQGSDLLGLIGKMERVLKMNDSSIFSLPQEPLIVAAAAANVLKIQPNWSALDDTEKETAYYSMADAVTFSNDFAPQHVASAPQNSTPISDNPNAGLSLPPNEDTGHSMDEMANNPAPSTPPSSGANLRPPGIAAFHCYLYQTAYAVTFNPRHNTISSGPYGGMTQAQATAAAKRDWVTLPDDKKAAYEQMAETTGDPIVEWEQHLRDDTPSASVEIINQ